MTKTLSGLQSGEFDDIDVFHTITINGEAGANNQVLTSDGDETSWKDVTIANNSVGTNQLADNAVTTDKLADNLLENQLGMHISWIYLSQICLDAKAKFCQRSLITEAYSQKCPCQR